MSTFCLLLDVGNTGIKLALSNENGLGSVFELPTDLRETPDSLGVKIREYLRLEQVQGKDIRYWLISSVVPGLNPKLAKAGQKFCQAEVYFVPEDLFVGINNQYQAPHEVGADRLVNAYAARTLYKNPGLVIVDFGTATTFDCIQENNYIGGLICPGVYTSMKALSSQTAKLPWFSLDNAGPGLEIGRNTVQSLAQGTLFGFASMVEGLIARLKEHMPPDTLVVATGGASLNLSPVCHCIDDLQPTLLLQGLRYVGIKHAILKPKE